MQIWASKDNFAILNCIESLLEFENCCHYWVSCIANAKSNQFPNLIVELQAVNKGSGECVYLLSLN